MPGVAIKRALISVYDKTGVVDFARALVSEFGVEILSTGGTAALLEKNDIPVTLVEHITGTPEMLDGRVKTLHPKIFAAILADRENSVHMQQLKEQGIEPIDMVVVNLYPFEKTIADPTCTFEQAIEMIDIGGPCLLRAAAKNQKDVLAVCESDEVGYERVLHYIGSYERSVPGDDLHRKWAWQTFWRISKYDAGVARWLSHDASHWPPEYRAIFLSGAAPLRYGENPHQAAEQINWDTEAYDIPGEPTLVYSEHKDQTGELSFNNYLDGHTALELCKELTTELCMPAAVFIKHTNPCGIGVAGDPVEAYRRAYLGDPNAAMGGILACNFDVDADVTATVMDTYARWGKQAGAGGFFVEVWIAPKFASDTAEQIREAKAWGQRVRLLSVGDIDEAPDENAREYRSITGGMLVQSRDLLGLNEPQWRVVTRRQPSESERSDLRLAWLIAKHTKSNAVSICKDGMLIGNGAGQMSRVMSCRIATWLAKENGHNDRLAGAAAASDGFFPFPDGPEILMEAGITAIIQPGGSKRDAETIAACDARNVAMVLTGTRHFKH